MNRLKKLTMAAFFLLMLAVIAVVDIFAYENGVTATISQVWLGVNRKFWLATYIVATLMGILIQHVSVPRNPGIVPDQPFWPQALMWTPFFWLGMWITSQWLWQLPNVD